MAQPAPLPQIDEANRQVKMLPADCQTCDQPYYVGKDTGGTFENYEACRKAICPNALLYSGAPPSEDSAEFQDLKNALGEFVAAVDRERQMTLELVEGIKNGKYQSVSSLTLIDSYARNIMDPVHALTKNAFKFKSFDSSKTGNEIGAYFKDRFGDLSPQMAKDAVKLANDPRLQVTGMNELGAAYKYRLMYPSDDFQNATSRDIRDTEQIMNSAPADVRAVIDKSGLRAKLKALHDRAQGGLVNEVLGAEIQSVTDEIQWLVRTRRLLEPSLTRARLAFSRQLKSNREYLNKQAVNLPEEKLADGVLKLKSSELGIEMASDLLAQNAAKDPQAIPAGGASKLKMNDVTRAYVNCAYSINYSALTLPNKKQITAYNNSLKGLRQRIKAGLKGRFSDESMRAIGRFIDRVQFLTPPEHDAYLKQAASIFRSAARDKLEAAEAFRQDPEIGMLRGRTEDMGEATKQLAALCSKLAFFPMRDNTVSELGAIQVGSDAVKDLNLGYQFASHEIGHGISSLISKGAGISRKSRKVYDQAKSCLVKEHKPLFDAMASLNRGLSKELRDYRKPEYYAEEDFADAISAVVGQGGNLSCGLPLGGTDLDDSVIHSERDVKTRADLADAHSLQTFRMLNVEVQAGRPLTPACQDFSRAQGYEFKKCL